MMSFDHNSVYEAFVHSKDRFPHRPFLKIVSDTASRYGIEAREYTYTETADQVDQLIQAYHSANLGHGHRVALLLENRPEMFFNWLALNRLGVSVVPLNPDWREEELSYVLGHAEVQLVVCLSQRLEEVAQTVEKHQLPCQVVDLANLALPGFSDSPHSQQTIGQRTECALLYTSGTTGRPKGCVLSNEYFLWNGVWYAQLGGYCELKPGQDTLVTPLPMYHMNAMSSSTMGMLMSGSCIVPLDRFHPSTWWASVAEADATIVHYLGVMPAILMSLPEQEQDRQHKVRFGFGAGAGAAHHEPFEERYGFPLVEGWAMTETGVGGAIMAVSEPRHPGKACFGIPPDYLEIRIVGDDGQDVATGQEGELLIRCKGDNPAFGFFSGYLKNDAATLEAWADGYFHTGDVVRQAESGHMFFVDRKKNVIRRSGENIAAVEVEAVLLRHPEVVNVGVAAVPDETRGDEVMACVILQTPTENPKQMAQKLVRYCSKRLAYYKSPGYIHFCSELPLTATEKVQRKTLKDRAISALDDGNAYDLRGLKKKTKTLKRRERFTYDDIAIAAPVTIPYTRYSTAGAHKFLGLVLRELLAVSGIEKKEVDGCCVSSFTLMPDTAVGLMQHFSLTPKWLDHIPMGGASGVVALRRAARAVQSGDAEVVACLSGDTNHVDSFRKTLSSFSQFARDAVYPYGSGGPNASFAFLTQHYMDMFGATREDFGALCVAQRKNAQSYPYALLRKDLSLEDYLNARAIADPIHLFDCVMPCAGGEGFLVMTKERAEAQGLAYATLLSTIERHNAYPSDPIQIRGGWALDVDEFYGHAQVSTNDVDFFQTYDDYPVISFMQLEDLGFCDKGEAADFMKDRDATVTGDFPINTSGGQLSVGQAGAAGGYLGLVEALRQLTDQTLGRVVANAQVGLVSGFGMINYDRGLCSGAAILARGAS